MDSLQGFLLVEVRFVPSWASVEDSALASYLDVLPYYFHVHNMSVWCWRSEVTPGLLAGAEPEAHQI
jgi:hypothetical protein